MNSQIFDSKVANDDLFATLPRVTKTYTKKTKPAVMPAWREPSGSPLFVTQETGPLDEMDKELLGGDSDTRLFPSTNQSPEDGSSTSLVTPKSDPRSRKLRPRTETSDVRNPQDPERVLPSVGETQAPNTKRSRKKRRAPVQGLALVSEVPIREVSPGVSKPRKAFTKAVEKDDNNPATVSRKIAQRPKARELRRSSIEPKDFKFPPKTPAPFSQPTWTPGSGFDGIKFNQTERKIPASSLPRGSKYRIKGSDAFFSQGSFPRALQLTTRPTPIKSTRIPPTGRKFKHATKADSAPSRKPKECVTGQAQAIHATNKPPPDAGSSQVLSDLNSVTGLGNLPARLPPKTMDPKSIDAPASKTIRQLHKSEKRSGWLKRKRTNFIPDDGFLDAASKLPEIIVTPNTPSDTTCDAARLRSTQTTVSARLAATGKPGPGLTRDSESLNQIQVRDTDAIDGTSSHGKLSDSHMTTNYDADTQYPTDPEDLALSSSSARMVPDSSLGPQKHFSNAIDLLGSSPTKLQLLKATKSHPLYAQRTNYKCMEAVSLTRGQEPKLSGTNDKRRRVKQFWP